MKRQEETVKARGRVSGGQKGKALRRAGGNNNGKRLFPAGGKNTKETEGTGDLKKSVFHGASLH
jgi:hypothetical protein